MDKYSALAQMPFASYTEAADVKNAMHSRIAETADTNIRLMGYPLSVSVLFT